MSEHPTPVGRSPSWWTTLPGVLTALAAIITALTGLLVAVSALRPADGTPSQADERATVLAEESPSGTPGPTLVAGPAADYRLTFPSGMQVSVRDAFDNLLVYTVLETSVAERGVDALELELQVRGDNEGDSAVLFGDGSFRLLVDGTSRTPTNYLNESIDARSTTEGVVRFQVPPAVADLVLRIQDSSVTDPVDLPMELRPS